MQASRKRSKWLGALSGVLVGFAALSFSGPALAISDARDRAPMSQALNDLMQFAEPGRSVSWENPVTGNRGDVKAVRSFVSGGQNCWSYERTYSERGVKKLIEGTACELVPGLWQITGEGSPRDLATESASASPPPKQVAATPKRPTYDRALVRQTQALLTNLGYNPGPIDGAYGRRTRTALVAYQTDHGLDPSGQPSNEVLEHLKDQVARKAAVEPSRQAPPKPEPPTGSIPTVTPDRLTPSPSDTSTGTTVAPGQPTVLAPSPEPAATPAPSPQASPSASDLPVPPPPPPPPPPE